MSCLLSSPDHGTHALQCWCYSQGLSERDAFVKNLVKEVVGLQPYEKRIVELLKIGREKRALKYAKKKLGTHTRGKKKREEMQGVMRKAKK